MLRTLLVPVRPRVVPVGLILTLLHHIHLPKVPVSSSSTKDPLSLLSPL